MNRKKKLLRVVAAVICLVLLLGANAGISAAETDTKYVSDINELLSAIKYADDGDVIVIYGEITISTDLEVPKGQITIERGDMNSCLLTRNGVRVDFQNMNFEGNSWKSAYPFITIQGDFSFENCTFQNCGDPDNLSSSGCIGGAVQIKQGIGTFSNCIFQRNNAVSGGHVAVMGSGTVSFNQCFMENGYSVSSGGAIAITGKTTCEINSCVITENSAGDFGGGVLNNGDLTVKDSRIFGNTATNGGADIGNKVGAAIDLQDSVERLNELFAEDNIIVHGWVCDYDFGQGIFIPDVDPAAENALLKLDYEYKQPEPEIPEETEPTEPEPTEPEEQEPTEPAESEEQPTETEEPDESQSEQPTEEEPNIEPEAPDDGNPDEEPTIPATPSEPSVNNNSTTTTTTTNSNSSTDNSDRSTHSTTTDNSRRTETNDSNNTSTVNNYYAQDQQPSSGRESVQTIVVPAGNSGSGEPIEQTIRVETPDGSTGADGMTLNVNVNIGEDGTPDQEAEASPQQQDGASWYQVAVLCLLSAILVCVIKKR
ncbi:right-handed parallel beta-helix repeat-containing protein [Pseudoflavonifractor sp. An85]|uniref:right-handed parallel beta-helix repeat-containing protein n=1 Tax=Pseudoflavonifractor sp. An85 TaxID=1965661 RepID=UPI000B39942B|nr:right-handed parallel beta-helix repeat-containing protein [Pseudoflavonifractor sp. An85]OUN22721.1 hypothetical protein B5G37_09275 [Pseudoflavonifractor sp. An85]